jgi:hypothetical protein
MASVATDLMTSPRQSSLWLHRNNLGASGVAAWKQSHYLLCKVCMRRAVFSPLEEVVVVWVAGGWGIFQSVADFPSFFFFFFFFFLVPKKIERWRTNGYLIGPRNSGAKNCSSITLVKQCTVLMQVAVKVRVAL